IAFFALTQRLLSLFALSNVLNVRYKIKRLSRPIAQQIAPHMRPNGMAILVQILLLNFEKLNAAIQDRKSTRLNSSHRTISYAVFCLKKKKESQHTIQD